MKEFDKISGISEQVIIENCFANIEDEELSTWFEQKIDSNLNASQFYLTFGMIGRKFKEEFVTLNSQATEAFMAINPAFDPAFWTLKDLCRLCLILKLPIAENTKLLETLLGSSDRKEQIIIFKSIQYLKNAGDFVMIMADGLRTNMVDVFDAIALNNSFGQRYFEDNAWNQMILKSIFMERPLYRILGVDKRKNEKLASILYDFVKERWSAGRLEHPELWRVISGYESEEILKDLIALANSNKKFSSKSAVNILLESDQKLAIDWRQSKNSYLEKTDWDVLGMLFENELSLA